MIDCYRLTYPKKGMRDMRRGLLGAVVSSECEQMKWFMTRRRYCCSFCLLSSTNLASYISNKELLHYILIIYLCFTFSGYKSMNRGQAILFHGAAMFQSTLTTRASATIVHPSNRSHSPPEDPLAYDTLGYNQPCFLGH